MQKEKITAQQQKTCTYCFSVQRANQADMGVPVIVPTEGLHHGERKSPQPKFLTVQLGTNQGSFLDDSAWSVQTLTAILCVGWVHSILLLNLLKGRDYGHILRMGWHAVLQSTIWHGQGRKMYPHGMRFFFPILQLTLLTWQSLFFCLVKPESYIT